MDGVKVAQRIMPHIVRIHVPGAGTGSGVYVYLHADPPKVCIATAAHCLMTAGGPLRSPIWLEHVISGQEIQLEPFDGVLICDEQADLAVLAIEPGRLPLPAVPLPVAAPGADSVPVGAEVAWAGCPGMLDRAAFLVGRVAARQGWCDTLVIDGWASPGLSGGPVVRVTANDIEIVGITYGTKGGLLFAHEMRLFHTGLWKPFEMRRDCAVLIGA